MFIEFIFDTFIGMYYGSVRKRSTSTLEEIGFFLFFFFKGLLCLCIGPADMYLIEMMRAEKRIVDT